ncbi:FAD-dependent monooxygenase [Paraglaciecola aestuariivivens]
MQGFDILIVGGGIVGLTQALALQNSGLSIAIVESNPSQGLPNDEPQLRISALTLATENIMRNLGVWQNLDASRLSVYKNMQVRDQDSFAKIEFSAEQVAQDSLGFIVENQNLRHALWQQVEKSSQIEIISAKILQLSVGQQECFITLDNQLHISARLVIGADGANSIVKKQAKLPQTFWDYDQKAIVATVKTTEPHHNVARQIFTPTGPLAFIPLWDEHLCSIVWSQDTEHADELMALPNSAFNQALSSAFDCTLGVCEVVSDKQAYPLKMQYLRQWVQDRVVIIGDAAHTIHPLAGQGANLGIADAAALAQHIKQLVEQGKDIGLGKNLRAFERWRKTECTKMLAAMETFKRLFAGNQPVKKLIRGAGLSWVNQSNSVKQRLMQHAMGLSGELPELAMREIKSEV